MNDKFDYTNRETTAEQLNQDMQILISSAKKNLQKLKLSNPKQLKAIEKQLQKIESLKPLQIPTEQGQKQYYSVADSVGGVTKKTCLIDRESLILQLKNLAEMTNLDDLERNEIQINAILKHPKAGKDTEVQREAIGLEIARKLGFNAVTESTMVNHDTGNGMHPCLFVPFGEMDLLTKKIDNAASSHGRLKEDESKIVEDFGKYAGFFALCSDPDFIGKKGQNKGVTRGSEPKRLYIFDQVFMTDKNLSLDRSFNLVPTNILSKMPNFIARHYMGRNKSVVNDSSLEEKITGVMNILQKKEDIQEMFKGVIQTHKDKKDNVSQTLHKDAKQCLKSFNERVAGFEKLFPLVKVKGETKKVGELIKDKNDDALNLLKQSMLVGQLINKPQMRDKKGKPYRAPFLNNPATHVKSISISDDGEQVTICFARKFGKPLSEKKMGTLKTLGFAVASDGKSATISKEELLKLTSPTSKDELLKLTTPTPSGLSKENPTIEFRAVMQDLVSQSYPESHSQSPLQSQIVKNPLNPSQNPNLDEKDVKQGIEQHTQMRLGKS